MRRRYDVGDFQCTVCLRRFVTSNALSDHQRDKGHDELTGAFGGLGISVSSRDVYTLKSDTLEIFIADSIQADSVFLGCCGEVIDRLVRKLQAIESVAQNLLPRRIIKSGSLGKGTAVKNRSDIDLIMMLVRYDDVQILMREMSRLLGQLERYLMEHTKAKLQRTTRYSVQVELTCRCGQKHDVDILPAVDLLEIGYTPADVYRIMGQVSSDIIHEYSASLSPLQLDIIKTLPPKVKSLIKLVKYWKNEKLKEKDTPEMPSFAEKRIGKPNWPSSYALELVIMKAWTEANEPVSFDMIRALHAVLTALVNHRQFKIILKGLMKYDQAWVKRRSAPYIMDPANPFNDMYHGLVDGKAFDWDMVVPEARTWLAQPIFYGVSNTEHRWK